MVHIVVGRGPYMRQMQVPFWAIALGGAATVLLGVLLLAFLASLAVVILPACLIGAAAAHFLSKPRGASREPIFNWHRQSDPNIIEGEYRVLNEKRR